MALSKEITQASLAKLLRKYEATLNATDIDLLDLINGFAAEDDIDLSSQSPDIQDGFIKLIRGSESATNDSLVETSALIYTLIMEQLALQTVENQRKYNAVGRFDGRGLHLRAERDQMQDHDMQRLMPQSTGSIGVSSVINRDDPDSVELIQEFITDVLFDENIDHLIIPVGPGHWRGVYITKPTEMEPWYAVELFDPYGHNGGAAIEDYVMDLLAECGLPREQAMVYYSGPPHPQGDAYSCGDFTCAYSHKKMQEFGAAAKHYNTPLIQVLDDMGNEDDALRATTRAETQKLIAGILVPTPVAIIPPIATPKPERVKSAVISSVQEPKNTLLRPGLEIGGIVSATGLGAVIGGLIGFFLLPGIGAIAGAAIGAGIGALLSAATVGLIRLAMPVQTTPATATAATTATIEESSAHLSKLGSAVEVTRKQTAEPGVNPPLFSHKDAAAETQHTPQSGINNGPSH